MAEELKVGRAHTLARKVDAAVTADQFGNKGVYVFATPALIALLEETAIACAAPGLTEGQGTVGTKVDIQHLAATPVGMTVTARTELIEVDGRRLVFSVEASDDREPVATGTHERFIVNSMEKFLTRASEKALS
jgi:fluoroacetyl-CoA thioesterase